MIDVMEGLHKNETWDLVPLLEGKQPVGCCWVYTIKFETNGSIERSIAQLLLRAMSLLLE